MNKIKKSIFRLLFIALAIISIASCNKKKFDGFLYPIRENGLYGYIDSVGNRLLEPKFLWVSSFHNGLAMAVVDTIYREVPDSMAYEVGERDTVINMYRMYAKYGYIDKTGKFLIKPTFVCYISMPQNGFHVNDLQECSNALYLHVFQNNRALFSDTITWKNGYIDKNGNVVISPKYYYSNPFTNGKAIVMLPKGEQLVLNDWIITRGKLRSAYIDTTGNAITDFKYEKLTRFNGRCGIGSYKEIFSNVTGIKDGYTEHNYIIDENGTEIKDLGFWNQFYGFSKDGIGLARQVMRLQVFDGMPESYSYIDEKGNYLEPLKGLSSDQLDSLNNCKDILQVLPEDAEISHATQFNNGFAGISPDGKHWFVIDKYLLIHGYGEESIYEGFGGFSNGLAAVKRNGKWGFINTKIKEQIPCKYDSCGGAYPYLEEIFEYDIQGNVNKIAYINRKDSLVWESKVLKVNEIKNEYSDKEKKDWGKWTYKYNPFLEDIQFWIMLALSALLLIVLIAWGVVRIKVPRKQTVMPTDEQPIQMQTNIDNSTVTTLACDDSIEEEDIRTYPSVGQYTETIKLAAKAPEDYFEKLSNLRPVLDANGEPVMSSGNFAVVYKMVDEKGKYHAVRCFHREQEGRGRSYKLICEELDKVRSPYLLPVNYLEKELFVDSEEYPVLLMDWVEGITLDKYIRKIIDDKIKLRSLAYSFRNMSVWLLNQPFAHGDLKPDNILVREDGSLVLVDYDGMFLPAMQGQKAREIGSPDFRNPSRTENDFDKDIDTLPIISILLSLELLLEDKNYLSQFGAEDRLLFSANDYSNIDDSTIYKLALTSKSSIASKLAIIMRKCIKRLCNRCDLIRVLDINKMTSNVVYDKITMFIIVISFIGISYLSLVLRSYFGCSVLLVSMAIILALTIILSACALIDVFRPNQEEHLVILGEDNIGCFAYIALLPLLMMGDFFSNWINGLGLPLISELPLYDNKWYITALIWGASYIIGWVSLNMPNILMHLRMHYYMTSEEKVISAEQEEILCIRRQLEEEKRNITRNQYRHYYIDDEFLFDQGQYYEDYYDYY